MPEIGEQAAQVLCPTGIDITAEVVRRIIEMMLSQNKDKLQHDKHSMKSFNKHDQEFENVEIKSEDLKVLKRQLKKYGVDFAIMKDKENGNSSVFFKARDSNRMYEGLEKVIKGVFIDWDKNADKKQIKETLKQAEQRAAQQERGQQHAPDKQYIQNREDR